MDPVELTSRWHEILGNSQADMPDELRRERWEQWKTLCLQQKDGKEVVSHWTDSIENCTGCMHLDGDWCRFQQLPATVNPILTFSSNMAGMACMGVGFNTKKPVQGSLW